MFNTESLLIDGIFIKPFGFYQTLIIMYLDPDLEKFIPTCFILLNNKTRQIYHECIHYIKSKLCNNKKVKLKLKTVTCDFEQGLINAIQDNFNDITIVGCYFHHKKCLIRKAQSLGLTKDKLLPDTKQIINKELGLIPFKNFENNNILNNYLDCLEKKFKYHTEFIQYYKSEWIKFFENKMLKYNRIPKTVRTISNLENYNGQLLKIIYNKKISSCPEYINLLIKEEHKYKLRIIKTISENNNENMITNNNNKGKNITIILFYYIL